MTIPTAMFAVSEKNAFLVSMCFSKTNKPVKTFYKVVVFCSNPIKGKYQFEDKFQIYPFESAKAPKSKYAKFYPIAFEYWVDHSVKERFSEFFKGNEAFLSKHTQAMNRQKEILNLLSSITNYRFYFPPMEFTWLISMKDEMTREEVDAQTSHFGATSYRYPEMFAENIITGFSTPVYPALKFVKHPECFINLDVEGTEEVTLPQHTTAAVHNYFALADDARKSINSAASLIANGIDLRIKMKSISFVSFVSSIETMVNFEHKGEEIKTCGTCKAPIFSVAAKFRDYLFKYASANPAEKKTINKIYQLRSKIVHTGMLLFGDNTLSWSDDKKHDEQWHTHIQAMQIARVSLTNWLLKRAEEQKTNAVKTQ